PRSGRSMSTWGRGRSPRSGRAGVLDRDRDPGPVGGEQRLAGLLGGRERAVQAGDGEGDAGPFAVPQQRRTVAVPAEGVGDAPVMRRGVMDLERLTGP